MRRVLIIDDDVELGETLALGLEHEGFAVACATNGERGLEMARRLRPDLVIIDGLLPDRFGHEICAELRRDPATSVAMLVFLSGYARDQWTADRLAETGVSAFLRKPIDSRTLALKLRVLLSTKALRGLLFRLEPGQRS